MNQDRKQIIVQELKYWKENKLLPSEYCDFLLALYTGGEGIEETPISKTFSWRIVFLMLDVTLILFLLPLSFLVIYFTQLSLPMQTGLIFIFLCIALAHVFAFNRKNSIYVHLTLIVFLLIILLFSIFLVNTLTESNGFVMATVIINCIGWLVLGFKKRLNYLMASSFIGIILLVGYMLF